MVSSIFSQGIQQLAAKTNTYNDAGGTAYKLTNKEALTQLALTGTFNNTFYAKGEKQLDNLKQYAALVPPEFVAKLAVYARKNGLMKDTPVALLSWLIVNKHTELARSIAPQVLDNGKQIRNFVQMMRCGSFGRKSLGSAAKSIVRDRLNAMDASQLLWASVGNSPSLSDVIKLSHPKPKEKWREAAYAYFIGKESKSRLPIEIAQFERFKKNRALPFPNLPIEAITPLLQTPEEWGRFAREGSLGFLAVLKNLNAFNRHGALDKRLLELIAKGGRVMPYQIMTSIAMTESLPAGYQFALGQALEKSLAEVPSFPRVVIGVDTSGSMASNPITGFHAYGLSKVTCRDVAALIAAAFIDRSELGLVVPFDTQVQRLQLGKSIMENTKKLAAVGGGGTDCSIPLGCANQAGFVADVVVMISDNESWSQGSYSSGGNRTGMMEQWAKYKKNVNPKAKLVCIDLIANTTTQASSSRDILNVGGFSDSVFTVIKNFITDGDTLVQTIDAIDLTFSN